MATKHGRYWVAAGVFGGVGGLVAVCHLHPSVRKYSRRRIELLRRSLRVLTAGAGTALDYRLSLRGLPKDSEEREAALRECHKRAAQRCLHVCRLNAGVFIKVGQSVSALRPAAPEEFTDAFKCLMDAAPITPVDDVYNVLLEEIGTDSRFAINPVPIGSASLAQVHSAQGWQDMGRVAIKVQHPIVADNIETDLLALSWVLWGIEKVNPDLHVRWVEPLMRESLMRELDFRLEAENAVRMKETLASVPWVKVPTVFTKFVTKRVLVMEFEEGCRVDDMEGLREMQLRPRDVAGRVCELFGRQIYLDGFVHADPHPGNILVRPTARKVKGRGREHGGIELVLLDYGMCREIPAKVRSNYASLWRAMVLRDAEGVDRSAEALGVGRWSRLLPLILTHRSVTGSTRLGERMDADERRRAIAELQGLGVSGTDFQPAQVGQLLKAFPEDLLFVFRTKNLVRALCSDLGAPSGDRFVIYARLAAEALSLGQDGHQRAGSEVSWRQWSDGTMFRLRLAAIEALLALTMFFNALFAMVLRR
eukprot:TRINITY_DN70150_c0_g1_i1.p1 TRINITY_DN70150_c0_g1~~TRINITY_DN70150_c0_g1_i1.p1  ORF type:complete len:562 (+),score=190.11 TRINITY_DN70150_c0_g1_i1:84-1688(+)